MAAMREIASGLQFPEGPIAMSDGSVILVEIQRGTLSRVDPQGRVEVVGECGGGPNGAAIGPDGAVYVCNNGGFEWHVVAGLTAPGHQPADYIGGRIARHPGRKGHRPLHRVRRPSAARPERHRLRRRGRVLLHRPRQDEGA